MKLILALVALFISTSAMASPFDAFMGSYSAVGKPEITGDGMQECNWINFSQVQSIQLRKDESGDALFSLTSLLDHSPMTGTFSFKEYRYVSDLGTTTSAVASGDFSNARFRVLTQGNGFHEVLTFSLARTSNQLYRLMLSEEYADQAPGGRMGSCDYQVDLKKN